MGGEEEEGGGGGGGEVGWEGGHRTWDHTSRNIMLDTETAGEGCGVWGLVKCVIVKGTVSIYNEINHNVVACIQKYSM